MSDKTWYMYIVTCSDKSFYCGITTDLDRRVDEHNTKKTGAKYTRSRRPVTLLFFQEFQGRSDALKSEAAFKKLKRHDKLLYMTKITEERLDAEYEKFRNSTVDVHSNSPMSDHDS